MDVPSAEEEEEPSDEETDGFEQDVYIYIIPPELRIGKGSRATLERAARE